MQSLIRPCPLAEFWGKLWDQRPVLITRRASEGYFGGLFTLRDVESLLQQQPMRYCWNVDVTRYAEVPALQRCSGTDRKGTDPACLPCKAVVLLPETACRKSVLDISGALLWPTRQLSLQKLWATKSRALACRRGRGRSSEPRSTTTGLQAAPTPVQVGSITASCCRVLVCSRAAGTGNVPVLLRLPVQKPPCPVALSRQHRRRHGRPEEQ